MAFAFGRPTFQGLGLTPYYDELQKRLLVFPQRNTLVASSTLRDPPVSIQISCPHTIDFDGSKPVKVTVIPYPRGFDGYSAPDLSMSSIIIEDDHLGLLRNPNNRTSIKPRLDAPAFDFDKTERSELFSANDLNWQWIITPKKEGNQSLSIDFTFESVPIVPLRDGSPQAFRILSNPMDLVVVKPFVTFGQINLATIITAVLGGLLAVPKLVDLMKALLKRKPKPPSLTTLGEEQESPE